MTGKRILQSVVVRRCRRRGIDPGRFGAVRFVPSSKHVDQLIAGEFYAGRQTISIGLPFLATYRWWHRSDLQF